MIFTKNWKKEILDPNYILKNTTSKSDLKVTLKQDKIKGTCLYSTKSINKNNIIAYYKVRAYRYSKSGPFGSRYLFVIYTIGGNTSNTFVGNLSPESVDEPFRGKPFWAFFSNEPGPNQIANAYIKTTSKPNLREGDYLVYKLIASRNIKPNEEITWCYGENYDRDYEPNCNY
jgi:hypothetical protein